MDEFDFFDKTDIKDISKKTRISIDNLQYLKNEEFDKLSKTKGLGFIRIIEREYQVDLSQKREKLIQYLKEHDRFKNKEFFIAPPSKSRYTKSMASILLMLIAFGIFFIFYLKTGNAPDKNINEFSQNPIINETKNLSGIEINATDINDTNKTKELSTFEKNDTNKTKVLMQKEELYKTVEKNISISKTDKNIKNSVNMINTTSGTEESNRSQIILPSAKEQDNNKTVLSNNLVIFPKKRLWVGVINLDNYKKKSYLTDGNITINTNSNIIIATGHGEFRLDYNNKILDFSTVNPMRFLVKDGNITKISRKDFIKLNRGKYW